MSTINLLPWRDEVRNYLNKLFYLKVAITLGASLMLAFASHLVLSHQSGKIKAANDYLRQEIKDLDGRIQAIESLHEEKNSLKSRMHVIQSLQSKRFSVVKLLDKMVRLIPVGIYLDSIAQVEDKVSIEGRADSNANIAELIKNLSNADGLSGAHVEEIGQSAKGASPSGVEPKKTFFKLEVTHLSDGSYEAR
jgi:type IV pilus assembly protein PilN